MAAVPSRAILPKIRSAAARALDLDNTLGEAHIDLAICAEYEFDWETAGKEFQTGLELSPQNAVGHLWYAKYLALIGRRPEVLMQRKTAAELDPVSPYAIQSVGGYLSVMGRYDEAISQFRSALAVDPNFGLTHQGLGVAYLLKGRPDEGIAELQLACRLMDGPRRLALLGWAYAVSGKRAELIKSWMAFCTRPNVNLSPRSRSPKSTLVWEIRIAPSSGWRKPPIKRI